MKRIFSGVKPSGPLHLGNYLGALRNWVELQHEYESFFCIVNLHAITVPQDPAELRERTRETARLYLAVGIDPQVSTVFVQSEVAAHAELTWLLNCVSRMSELERMTQFKDKARKQVENIGVGFFDYPVLMASDILLYQTDLVPVGEDQKQHLELTRDLAIRFNRDFGETFRIPEAFIPKVGARIMSLSDPSKKMSKSDEDGDAGCVMLMDTPDVVQRKFKRAVTDSGTEIRFDDNRPAISNLLSIYQLLTGKGPEDVEANFAGKGYATLKQELADVTIAFLQPLQERAGAIDSDKLDDILERGAKRARSIASSTLSSAKTNMGITGAKRD
ncbi:MAG: tryptophanyl-tRNA synthetase [Blastocatellia bacterium]|jgi:tryptophanyl-tRNA synthetase|nr:tryptophanyl-tRNA synthetase [Blastocatellia bacterium]